MALIRPRLNDHYNLPFTQEQVDFAIPFLDEDLPLYIDPFLLWKSPAMQDNSLHAMILNAFNHLGKLSKQAKRAEAIETLIIASECNEIGLGASKTRKGHRIGEKTASEILDLFDNIPRLSSGGFTHFEEIQFYIDHISADRISDISASLAKSFLIDYTIDQCRKHMIPLAEVNAQNIYDHKKHSFVSGEKVHLPVNPETGEQILLVPKRWLRYSPWINYEDYFSSYYNKDEFKNVGRDKVSVLTFNRHNYDIVLAYIEQRERQQADCQNDPLFKPIPVLSAKKKLSTITGLPSGKKDNADKKYEDAIVQLFASLLYPHMDFADDQVRVDSGSLIRDLIFYNNRSFDFLQDIYDLYGSRQIVFELKNVRHIERDHIYQINRYLNDEFGRFGILVTRNPLPRAMQQNLIDLWSGQRRCILALTDADVKMMVDVFESKQRHPIEVIKKAYIEFTRKLPS